MGQNQPGEREGGGTCGAVFELECPMKETSHGTACTGVMFDVEAVSGDLFIEGVKVPFPLDLSHPPSPLVASTRAVLISCQCFPLSHPLPTLCLQLCKWPAFWFASHACGISLATHLCVRVQADFFL